MGACSRVGSPSRNRTDVHRVAAGDLASRSWDCDRACAERDSNPHARRPELYRLLSDQLLNRRLGWRGDSNPQRGVTDRDASSATPPWTTRSTTSCSGAVDRARTGSTTLARSRASSNTSTTRTRPEGRAVLTLRRGAWRTRTPRRPRTSGCPRRSCTSSPARLPPATKRQR